MSRLTALAAVCEAGNPPSHVLHPNAVYSQTVVLPAKCAVQGVTQTATPKVVE